MDDVGDGSEEAVEDEAENIESIEERILDDVEVVVAKVAEENMESTEGTFEANEEER